MAEDGGSSISSRNSPRNGESMPPPPPLSLSSPAQQHLFSDSATFAKTVGGGAGMHNASSPGCNSTLRVNAPTYRPSQRHLDSTFAKTAWASGKNDTTTISPGGNSSSKCNAPTYRPSQFHPVSTSGKTAWASGKNVTTTSSGRNRTLGFKATGYPLSKLPPDPTLAKTVGASGKNGTVMKIVPCSNTDPRYNAPTYRLVELHPDSTSAKTVGASGGNHISADLERQQQLFGGFNSGAVTSSRAVSLPSHDSALSHLNAAPSLHPDSMGPSANSPTALRAPQGSEKLPHRRAQNLLTHPRSQQLEPRETPRTLLQEGPTPQQLEMPRFQQQETREQDKEALLFQQQERPGTQQPRELLRSQSSPADTVRFAQQAERLRLQREIEIGRQAKLRLQQLTVGQPMVLTESPCLSLANPSASLDTCKLLTTTPPHALTSEGSASQSAWRQSTGYTGYTGLTGHAEARSWLHLDPVNASVDSLPSRIPI